MVDAALAAWSGGAHDETAAGSGPELARSPAFRVESAEACPGNAAKAGSFSVLGVFRPTVVAHQGPLISRDFFFPQWVAFPRRPTGRAVKRNHLLDRQVGGRCRSHR